MLSTSDTKPCGPARAQACQIASGGLRARLWRLLMRDSLQDSTTQNTRGRWCSRGDTACSFVCYFVGHPDHPRGLAKVEVEGSNPLSRYPLGLELERALPGGVLSRWQRDNTGSPLQHEVTAGEQTLRAVGYTWEVNDRLRRVVDAMNPDSRQSPPRLAPQDSTSKKHP